MILFIQERGAGGFIRISHATSVRQYMLNIQRHHREPLRLIGQRQSRVGLLQRIRVLFAEAHRGNEWYEPVPALIRYILDGAGLAEKRANRKRLSAKEAYEVFRAAHETTMSYAEIGAQYGVSALSVGAVARGQTHAYLFKRRPDATEKYVYWISEATSGAREWRMVVGRRSARGGRVSRAPRPGT